MFWAIVVSSASGILCTGLGAALACAIRNPSHRLLSRLMSATAGMMLAVACFDLLPEAFAMAGYGIGLAGLMGGAVLVRLLASLVDAGPKRSPLLATGLLVAAGIAAHNLPEGLAIGAGFAGSPALGFAVGLVIACHDMPEGLAMGIPLSAGGMRPWKVFTLAALSGVPTALGGIAGYAAGSISAQGIGLCMGIAGGAMLSIVAGEMLPEAGALDHGKPSALAFTTGVLLGIAAIMVSAG